MQTLIELGNKSPNSKEFDNQLAKKLECTSITAFSKHKRKCKRVAELGKLLGATGASLTALYITIHCLENAVNDDWNKILQILTDNTELIA